jgi:hypothetical protein
MTTHSRYRFIGVALVLAHLLNALFAILLAALLLFLLTYLGWPTEELLLALLMERSSCAILS